MFDWLVSCVCWNDLSLLFGCFDCLFVLLLVFVCYVDCFAACLLVGLMLLIALVCLVLF